MHDLDWLIDLFCPSVTFYIFPAVSGVLLYIVTQRTPFSQWFITFLRLWPGQKSLRQVRVIISPRLTAQEESDISCAYFACFTLNTAVTSDWCNFHISLSEKPSVLSAVDWALNALPLLSPFLLTFQILCYVITELASSLASWLVYFQCVKD